MTLPMSTARSKPTASVVYVTPDMAKRWLAEANTNNRTVNKRIVKKYAQDMADGEWALTGAPIQFSVHGEMLDGQHRAHAVVAAGVTVPLFIVRGLPKGAQAYMDVGRKRTTADQLTIAGITDAAMTGAAARLALLLDHPGKKASDLTDAQIRRFLELNPTLHECATVAAAIRRNGLDMAGSVVAVGRFLALEAGADPVKFDRFLLDLASMVTTGDGDPRRALLRRVQTARGKRERMHQMEALALLVRAWNLHARDRRVKSLPVTSRQGRVQVPKAVAA